MTNKSDWNRRLALTAGLSATTLALLSSMSEADAAILENVLFLDDASGTTTKRSEAARWGELFFNVRSYGATGDGVTDDWPFINAAMNAILSSGGYGTLFFPIGKYLVTQPLNFTSNGFLGIKLLGQSGLTDHTGTVSERGAGSLIFGNFAGYIIDRFQIESGIPGFRSIDGLGIYNPHPSGGGIRWLGTDVGYIRNCDVCASVAGIMCGWDSSPPTATFTGTTVGGTSTTIDVTGCVGTISNQNGSIVFPVPFGPASGVTSPTSFTSYISGGTPGSNGRYTTDNPTTCPGVAGLETHPNAPTAFCLMIADNHLNGTGSFNADPTLSFTEIGIQGSPEVRIVNNHADNWGVGIQFYGAGGNVDYNQLESNTYGMRIGVDGVGNVGFPMFNGTVMGNACESNYIALDVLSAVSVMFAGNNSQGNQDPGVHNSKYGTRVRGAQNCTFISENFGGNYTDAALYFSNPEYNSLVFLNAKYWSEQAGSVNVGKDAACNYAEVAAIRCTNFPAPSATLAQLNTMAGSRVLTPGDRFLMNNSNDALGSQPYGGIPTIGGSNLASVWWDGAAFRYG